jgi:hypothetical protein
MVLGLHVAVRARKKPFLGHTVRSNLHSKYGVLIAPCNGGCSVRPFNASVVIFNGPSFAKGAMAGVRASRDGHDPQICNSFESRHATVHHVIENEVGHIEIRECLQVCTPIGAIIHMDPHLPGIVQHDHFPGRPRWPAAKSRTGKKQDRRK